MKHEAIETLEEALRVAEKQVTNAAKALQEKHKGGEWEAFTEASDNKVCLERKLALARGEEAALSYGWEPAWSGGAPCPHVMSSGHRTLMLYYTREPDPNWDGSYVNVVDPRLLKNVPLAIVEIEDCYAYKFGGPNDEVFDGHPLSSRGFDGYGAFTIENSSWIEREKTTNSVHSMYSEENWNDRQHFLLAFHDDILECIATGFKIERITTTFSEAIGQMALRLLQ